MISEYAGRDIIMKNNQLTKKFPPLLLMNGGGLVCDIEDFDSPISGPGCGGGRRDPGGSSDATTADGPTRRQAFERGWNKEDWIKTYCSFCDMVKVTKHNTTKHRCIIIR